MRGCVHAALSIVQYLPLFERYAQQYSRHTLLWTQTGLSTRQGLVSVTCVCVDVPRASHPFLVVVSFHPWIPICITSDP